MKMTDGWQGRSIAEIITTLGSDSEKGLNRNKVAINRRKWEKNDLWYIGGPMMFFSSESGFSVLGYVFMIIAAFSASAFGKSDDSLFVFLSILLGAIISTACYVSAGFICKKNSEKWIPLCTVIRDGKPVRVRADSLVLGDIILLSEGDRIYADVKLVMSNGIDVSEPRYINRKGPVRKAAAGSFLTVEGQAAPEDFIYSGSEIISGSGRAVVCAVGAESEQGKRGKIKLTSTKETQRLAALRKKGVGAGAFAMIFSFATIAIGVFSPFAAHDFIGMFLVFLAFAVSAGGELIPALCCLAYYLAINGSKNLGFVVRDTYGVDYLCNCDGIAAEDSSLMKSDKTELKAIWVSGDAVEKGSGKADELFSIMLAGSDYGKGKYGKEILLATEEQMSNKGGGAKFVSSVMNTSPVLEHKIIGTTHHSLYISGGEQYFSVTGSIEDIISKCTKLRVDGKDIPMRRENIAGILGAASEALKIASSIIAVAVRVSPYNNIKRLSVLTSDLTFVGFIAMETPSHALLPSGLAYLRSENVPFVLFTDGGGEDINFARKLGILRKREELLSANSPNDAVVALLSEKSGGGAVCALNEEGVFAVLNAAKKSGKRLVYIGTEKGIPFADYTVVCSSPAPCSAAYAATGNGGETSAVIEAFRTVRHMFGRLHKAYVYLFISSIPRAVYSALLLFGVPYVYPSVILAWGLVLDAIVAGLIIGLRKKD